MSSASPTTKDCPQCRALLAGDAPVCECGYRFVAAPDADRPATNLVTQAEELYETHLRARLQRALRVAKLAKVDLLRDPENPAKRSQLREAEQGVSLLETQITVQTARVADARAAAERSRTEAANNALPSADIPETFRASQSVKANQAFELVNLQRGAEQSRANEAPGVFKAVQMEKARGALRDSDATQTCPNCGKPVAIGVVRCDCGHRLHTGENASTDFISAEEFAALRRDDR